MKIVRYRRAGDASFGMVGHEGVVPLRQSPLDLADGQSVDELARPGVDPVPLEQVELLCPVDPPAVVAVGLNYREHVEEFGHALPTHPQIFLKAVTSVTGPGRPIVLPTMAPEKVDYESELVIVIGRTCRDVPAGRAGEVILGYTVGNDVTARDCQNEQDVQWARAKSFDTFCPLGPWIDTSFDPSHGRIGTRVNGTRLQDSDLSDMIFQPDRIVEFVSRCMTLRAGTVILTGSPPGVGYARDPQVFLRDGDTVDVDIDGLGTLVNPVTTST